MYKGKHHVEKREGATANRWNQVSKNRGRERNLLVFQNSKAGISTLGSTCRRQAIIDLTSLIQETQHPISWSTEATYLTPL